MYLCYKKVVDYQKLAEIDSSETLHLNNVKHFLHWSFGTVYVVFNKVFYLGAFLFTLRNRLIEKVYFLKNEEENNVTSS